MDGFRPGKVPMNVVAQRYGYSVHYEVMNDKVGEAFAAPPTKPSCAWPASPASPRRKSARRRTGLRRGVRGVPEVKIGDLAGAEVEKLSGRSERRRHRQDARHPAQAAPHLRAAPGRRRRRGGDRVTVDFEGKIDGEPFQGGKAEDFQFLVGEGQMLKEFDDAVRGMKAGESKTFPLAFPADYHGKDVAGKTSRLHGHREEDRSPHLPEVNEAFAKSLGMPKPRSKACAPTSRRTSSAK
jgi:trigger factor